MTATLTFDLPSERVEFEQASHAAALACTISHLDREARDKLKYGHDFQTPGEVLAWIREQIEPEVRSIAQGEVLP